MDEEYPPCRLILLYLLLWDEEKLKKFKFSLQSLLDLRAKKLEEKQIEFGQLQFVMRKLQTQLLNLKNEFEKSKVSMNSLLSSNCNMDISLINANQLHILSMKDMIMVQNQLIEEHKIKLDAKQQEMIEALKEKMMLEKLKEKQYKEFLKEIDMVERKELDEIGLMRYAR